MCKENEIGLGLELNLFFVKIAETKDFRKYKKPI